MPYLNAFSFRRCILTLFKLFSKILEVSEKAEEFCGQILTEGEFCMQSELYRAALLLKLLKKIQILLLQLLKWSLLWFKMSLRVNVVVVNDLNISS